MRTLTFNEKFENVVTLDELLFPVWVEDETIASNSDYSKRVVGLVNDNPFLLNQCSPRYELIPNKDIFPTIEQVLTKNGIQYEANYRMVNNARFYADYLINDPRYIYNIQGTTDKIYPKISVDHSYNGLTKYNIVFGYFRMICTNGLVIPVKEMNMFNLNISGKHTEAIKRSFVELDYVLKNFANNAHNVVGAINAKFDFLGGKVVVNVEDRVKEVLNAVKINIIDNSKQNTMQFITNIINHESKAIGMGGDVSDWLIYNGVNQYIDNDSLNIAVPEVRRAKDSAVLEYLLAH